MDGPLVTIQSKAVALRAMLAALSASSGHLDKKRLLGSYNSRPLKGCDASILSLKYPSWVRGDEPECLRQKSSTLSFYPTSLNECKECSERVDFSKAPCTSRPVGTFHHNRDNALRACGR
eukprot:CAMPEP_0119335328 /NCGR_PEP_ID=MMETSP1333-20130426/89365_1 /TAXON_ID=418940 /ORGANISM="Scyphosphaera apsteinii, Strain RCC1455" /LENGTH=119 /DNA_ID=CAMNT_0007345851 /DNA_START=205 /DNA_END=561 /DNA_ORIENTATION=+